MEAESMDVESASSGSAMAAGPAPTVIVPAGVPYPPQPPQFLFSSPYFPMFHYQAPDRIDEGLYLGSLNSASNKDELLRLGIKSILTVANDTGSPPFPSVFTYTLVTVPDSLSTDLSAHFDLCFKAIDDGIAAGGCLVHCLAGMSRSATVVIAYMMKTKGWDLRRALGHVKSCRPIVQPNMAFMRQLQEFESTLRPPGGKKKGSLSFARWFS